MLAAAEHDAGANRGGDKAPPSQGRRRLSEHAAAAADREAMELLWAVADGVELRRGDGKGDLASPGRCVTTALHPRD